MKLRIERENAEGKTVVDCETSENTAAEAAVLSALMQMVLPQPPLLVMDQTLFQPYSPPPPEDNND